MSAEMASFLSALVVAVISLIGVIVTSNANSKKTEAKLDKNQAITEVKLQALTEEVKKHNSFAERMPVLEERVSNIERTLDKKQDKSA